MSFLAYPKYVPYVQTYIYVYMYVNQQMEIKAKIDNVEQRN